MNEQDIDPMLGIDDRFAEIVRTGDLSNERWLVLNVVTGLQVGVFRSLKVAQERAKSVAERYRALERQAGW